MAHAIGVDIVEEVEGQTFTVLLKSLDHQQGSKSTPPDADPEHIRERLAVRSFDLTVQNRPGKRFDVIDFGTDVSLDSWLRGE